MFPCVFTCGGFNLQISYRAAGREEMSSPAYGRLADTSETQLARELSDMQSQVRARRRRGSSGRLSYMFLVPRGASHTLPVWTIGGAAITAKVK